MMTDKKITMTHRWWLKNVDNSVYMRVPLDSVGINSRRLDILFDMGLVRYGDHSKGENATYVVSDTGKEELKTLEAYIVKKRAKIKATQ